MDGKRDKYLLIAVLCSVVLIIFSFVPSDEDDEDCMTGIVSNVKESSNGYIFDFMDENGDQIRCFSKQILNSDSVYEISGSFSDDKTIFFISSFSLCQTQ